MFQRKYCLRTVTLSVLFREKIKLPILKNILYNTDIADYVVVISDEIFQDS